MTNEERTALRDQLRRHEGLRLKPYRCTTNKLTIGIGRNLDDKGITPAEAIILCDHDIDECLGDLKSFPAWFEKLDPVRKRAILDFRFNVGPGTFRKFKATIAALERGDFDTAAAALEKSLWAKQVQPERVATITRQVREGK